MAILAGACGQGEDPPRQGTLARGQAVLRAVYRDERAMIVLALPAPGSHTLPTGPCAQPLLIDPVTGQAVPIGKAEAARRITTMRLSGATSGTCPEG